MTELTTEQVIEGLKSSGHQYGFGANPQFLAAVAMLKATQPKPEFYVGWKGKDRTGLVAEIHAERNGRFFGLIEFHDGDAMSSDWNATGTFFTDGRKSGNDLIPNTTKETA